MKHSPARSLRLRSWRPAFTLIELVVIVAIVAILSALFLPMLNRSLVAARAARSASNLKQIGVAMRLFTAENDGLLVSNGGTWVQVQGKPTPQTGWRNLSMQYLSPTLDLATRKAIYLSPNAEVKCIGGNTSNYSAHPWIDTGTAYHAAMVQTPVNCVMIAEATTQPSSASKWGDARTELYRDWVGGGPNAINNGLPNGVTDADKALPQDDGVHPANNRGSKFSYRNAGSGLALMFDGSVRRFQKGEMTYRNFIWQ